MAELLKTPLTVVHVLACLFLVIVILLQPGKSGGMGAFGGGAQQVFGGRGAGNFLTKTTWVTATTFFLTSITLAYLSSSRDDSLARKAKQRAASSAPAPEPPPPAP